MFLACIFPSLIFLQNWTPNLCCQLCLKYFCALQPFQSDDNFRQSYETLMWEITWFFYFFSWLGRNPDAYCNATEISVLMHFSISWCGCVRSSSRRHAVKCWWNTVPHLGVFVNIVCFILISFTAFKGRIYILFGFFFGSCVVETCAIFREFARLTLYFSFLHLGQGVRCKA